MIRFDKPNLKDIPAMQKVVLADVENGNILVRNESEMATTIRSYTVAYKDEVLVGFVALHIHTPLLAEIRSLVVSSDLRGQGIGQELISHCINEARFMELSELLVLTYQAKLFEKFDFKVIEKSTIPDTKIWADCIKCKHFPICDEVALTLKV